MKRSYHISSFLSQRLTLRVCLLCALFAALITGSSDPAFALPADHYAPSSRLASGKWVKVRVEQTGVQFISAATLRKFGFSNPASVRVYGFGGREILGTITNSDPDDLPQVAAEYSDKGLWFFGFDYTRWSRSANSYTPYSHTLNPYAEESWYFLSDVDPSYLDMETFSTSAVDPNLPVIDSFIQPLLYENDLVHPSDTGSRYLGEDFRSPTRRSFDFNLVDYVEDAENGMRVAFATNTTTSSTLSISANASSFTNNTITISGITDSESFMRYSTSIHRFVPSGQNLKVDLAFSGGGAIKMARLDYIEVQYLRKLQLYNGELHFKVRANAQSTIKVANFDKNTILWDITDPVCPKIIKPAVSGNVASFTTYPGDYEFIAFTPDKCTRAITSAVTVPNQDLHSLDIPDMLIITPNEYKQAAETLAAHHRSFDGLNVTVLTPEVIYNEFSSATPDVSAFRRLMKMWHDRGLALDASPADDPADNEENKTSSRIKYCLIMARPTFDNKMKMEATKNATYPIIPIWQSPTGEAKTTSFSSDDFIGMLDDSQSFEIGRQKIHVAVGRFPFMSASEASSLTEKYIKYVTTPETGAWRNKIMMVADDQNYGDHLTQAEDMTKMLTQSESGKRFRIERIYLDSFPLEQSSRGPSYPQAKEKMLRLWNDGVMMINYIGHASTVSWTHEDLLNWTDMTSFSNTRTPFLYAATCEFGRFDGSSRSGAETLWAYPDAGIIGTVTPNRSVYIDMNGKLTHQVGISMLDTDNEGRGRRIGDIFKEAKNNYPTIDNTNKLRYVMIANPAMRLPVPTLNVNLSSINGVSVDSPISPPDYPVINAMGKAELVGTINNPDGSVAEDFSGLVEIHLYDAENAVETFGNGSAGVVSYYNDRKTLLYHGIAKAVNGKWSTTALIPSEIENNFSPAQFVFYAYTPDRKEANGANSRFYVYGTNENAPDDATGPDIEKIYLNRQNFASGDLVHSSPVLMARVSDPSGINLSDAGIGHSMMIVLDDKTYFTDVNTCFAPDPDDYTAGNITYPIGDIAPGKHTLRLVVWDNAKNSSSASIDFEVAVSKTPEIFNLYTDANPAKTNVNFTLSTDRPMATVDCRIEVFDLNGRKVWTSENPASTNLEANLTIPWNLCDSSGVRVPRGIYVYRATIISPEGPATSKSGKLAVSAL